MNRPFVSFDEVRGRVRAALDAATLPDGTPEVFVVRNLFGRIGLSVSEDAEWGAAVRTALNDLAKALQDSLGAYGRPAERCVLRVDPVLLDELRATGQAIVPGVFWADRLLVGEGWWTVGDRRPESGAVRYALHSIKGGVGRSTTAAVLAWHLARRGEDVLVVDMDIESPGLASAVLESNTQPAFGVTDWFVEELVGQGDDMIERMFATPAWAHGMSGNVWVVPSHGREPGEYLAKLGRAYMDTVEDPWTARLRRMLASLEATLNPTVVVIESRSGLHDIAAVTATDLDAEVLLFAVDSPSHWDGYGILFDHWARMGLARRIRDRLSIVSALTPEHEADRYLDRFRERAWNTFRDGLYDSLATADDRTDAISYDLTSEEAPHSPWVIRWHRGFAAGSTLRQLEGSAVEQAYSPFLSRFELVRGGLVPTPLRVGISTGIPELSDCSSVSPEHVKAIRIALSELPEGTSHSTSSDAVFPYLSPSHRKALHPNAMLVTGTRGAGKTFWYSALQNPGTRRLLSRLDRRLAWAAESEVHAGFGVAEAPDLYPGRQDLHEMLATNLDARLIWRTVHARHLADAGHPLQTLHSWPERVEYVHDNRDDVTSILRERDGDMSVAGSYSLVLFDALDLSASSWSAMFRLIRGLLEHALEMRTYRRLRAKVFLRSDQADQEQVARFPDASRVFSSSVDLEWSRRDLYGMLWQYLGNGSQGEIIRRWSAQGEWQTEEVEGRWVFKVPASLAGDENAQQERFHALSGPWMGTGPRRGFPYTWIPNHLGDAAGRVSPRSFIAALRTAAADTASRHRDHDRALHYDSVKRGVREASRIRVRELRRDYPWVDSFLQPLAGTVVPCPFKEVASVWERERILDQNDQTGQVEVRDRPAHIDRGPGGVRDDLESLGVFRRLADGRVDLPDVFRVGFGLRRRGGVKPVS
ncbi:MAG: P-loop NTPase [Gemmatimonadota bacterium]|nr:P-loop NTPase [Gemmatimonadota bacterium]MDE2865874.1 P-loop NTPase [Gemmatimonadota bacterium]